MRHFFQAVFDYKQGQAGRAEVLERLRLWIRHSTCWFAL